MIEIRQFNTDIDSKMESKWYISRDSHGVVHYLWPNGVWRRTCYRNDTENAYYNIKEEAEATLERFKGK